MAKLYLENSRATPVENSNCTTTDFWARLTSFPNRCSAFAPFSGSIETSETLPNRDAKGVHGGYSLAGLDAAMTIAEG